MAAWSRALKLPRFSEKSAAAGRVFCLSLDVFPMIQVTLPDGSKREYPGPVTVADVAASIGPGLAKAAIAGKVDGKVVDTSHVVDRDATVAILTERDAEG